ncbi:MAG: hypothetical protein FWC61_01480 [Proteobacteria bacterium]|nr:hypothetical protein [Pseudomonadota bacterium]
MRNVIYFLVGIVLLALTGSAVFLGGFLFDAAGDSRVAGFVFQPNSLAERRIGRPIPLEELSEQFVRERLITKFMSEYFYVIPDADNIAQRKGARSVMAAMSSPDVFADWRDNVAPDLEKMANDKVLRRVVVHDILKTDEYYSVNYDLIAWNRPNMLDTVPVVTSGVVYLQILTVFELDDKGQSKAKADPAHGIRNAINGIPLNTESFLRDGGDPAVIFKFTVTKVIK